MKKLINIKCLFKHVYSKWKQIDISYNGYGETEHQRTCKRCGKIQNKIF